MDGRTLRGKTAMFLIMCVFMVVFIILFGTEYAVVGVTIATSALIMLSKDLSVRPFSNLGSIMAFMVMMGIGAYLASLNPYLGLFVNFIVVFLIVFLSMQDLRSPMHFPLLLFYATMVTLPITLDQMPDRILVLAVSAVFIVGLNVLVNRGSRDRTSHNGIVAMCDGIDGCASDVLDGGHPDHADIDRLASGLSRDMYDRLKSHFFTTPNDRTVLDLVVSLADLGRIVCRGSWSPQALANLRAVTDAIRAHESGEMTAAEVSAEIESYLGSNPGAAAGTDMVLRDVSRELSTLESGRDDSTYGDWRSFDIATLIKVVEQEANRDSARFTFAVRMALIFALVAFAWEYWAWENAQVLLFTVVAVIVPFLEDSWRRSAMRLTGTVMGALVFGAAVLLSGDNTFALMAVGLVAAYAYILLDGDDRYDRKLFFYTLLVMIVSSMTVASPESSIVTDRVAFTFAGIVVGTIANRVVLPYRIRDENIELAVRSLRIGLERIQNIRDILDGRPDAEEEAGLAIISANISQKMLINADREDDPVARKFLMRQDSLSIQCSSLYKAVPYMSDGCRDAVRAVMSANPDSDDPLPVSTEGLSPYEEECVHRAEGIMATYRRNRRLMYDLIVGGFLDNGPVATTRT